MTLDEFRELLDPKNPMADSLTHIFEFMQKEERLVAERKGSDLVEVVQRLKDRRLFPVVDKKLRVVLASGAAHGLVRSHLFRYYYHAKDPDLNLPYVSPTESQDRYIEEKHGYFISSMRPSIIVVGRDYRPDSFDKDLFLLHDLDQWF